MIDVVGGPQTVAGVLVLWAHQSVNALVHVNLEECLDFGELQEPVGSLAVITSVYCVVTHIVVEEGKLDAPNIEVDIKFDETEGELDVVATTQVKV